MNSLQSWKEKIISKRSSTSFRKFVEEIVSRYPIIFHKNNGHLSRYPSSSRVGNIISNKEFVTLRDGLLDYGLEIDHDRDFFEQFGDLLKKIPLSATIRQAAGENTTYADSIVASSRSYLSSVVINECSDIFYSNIVFDYCKNIFNSFWVSEYSEDVYKSVGIVKSSRIFYSRYINNSSNVRFSANLTGCNECLACHGLENMSYCIQNKQYSKEEYEIKKNEILTQKDGFEKIIDKLPTTSLNIGSEEYSGNHILMSKNIQKGYFVNRVQNGKNIICVGGIDQEINYIDVFDAGVNSSDMYANEGAGSGSNNIYCSSQIEQSSNIFYSYYMVNCSHCLGCIGLQNKQFCIFNKQYSKEERQEKVDVIFSNMESNNTLGTFFPSKINPFNFNDTGAIYIEDFNKEDIIGKGYLWREGAIKIDIPEGADVVKHSELGSYESINNGKRSIDSSILQKVIQDESGNYYRIIQQEYKFLSKYNLPLPREHWSNSIKKNFKLT